MLQLLFVFIKVAKLFVVSFVLFVALLPSAFFRHVKRVSCAAHNFLCLFSITLPFSLSLALYLSATQFITSDAVCAGSACDWLLSLHLEAGSVYIIWSLLIWHDSQLRSWVPVMRAAALPAYRPMPPSVLRQAVCLYNVSALERHEKGWGRPARAEEHCKTLHDRLLSFI